MQRSTLLLLIMVISCDGMCTDEDKARRALEDAGYTYIHVGGYAMNKCSNDDSTCTSFRATGPTGRLVEGAVGCGRTACGKGCTIRTN